MPLHTQNAILETKDTVEEKDTGPEDVEKIAKNTLEYQEEQKH